MIEFRGVGKHYAGVPVVNALDLHVGQGELLVLIGASGAGKSTVLRMINRMVEYDTGQILLNGVDIRSLPVRELRLRMGYAIQSVGLFPHWNVARNIATVPHLLGWSAQRIAERVSELLALFQLDEQAVAHRYPHELSGGQQQRIGVARALAGDPQVLLMDEPFGALDPVTRAVLQSEIKRVHQQSGKTIVMVTHDVDEALALATRIVLLDRGAVVQAADPLTLLTRPANDFVLDFVGRSDVGIKRLSLQPARALVRAQAATAGPALPADASLREAISLMSQCGVQQLNLLESSGEHLGVLHAGDILTGARGP